MNQHAIEDMDVGEKRDESILCRLTEEELIDRGNQLAVAIDGQKAVETKKKQLMEQIKTETEVANHKVWMLKQVVLDKAESRTIEVEAIADHLSSRVNIIRTDTGEVVGSREMRSEERQQPLFRTKKKDIPQA
jgi:hypothetical protein